MIGDNLNASTEDFVEPDVSADNPESEHWIWVGQHRPPVPRALIELMSEGWAERAGRRPSPASGRGELRREAPGTGESASPAARW